MSIQRQRRRGTAAENAAFTGALGEFTYITDGKRIAAHDGSTLGGTLMPSNRDLINDYFGYASASGTDTITLTVLAQITAYAAGQVFTFKAAATNTGTATLNVNGLGAKTIKKKNVGDGAIQALSAGDILNGGIYTVRYDGTDMQLIDSASAGGAWKELASSTGSNVSSIDFAGYFSSSYDFYKFKIKDMYPQLNSYQLWMRTSTNGGSSYDASGYAYTLYAGTIGSTESSTVSASDTKILLATATANSAASGLEGEVFMFNPLKTTANRACELSLVQSGSFRRGYAQRSTAADVDAVRFMAETGSNINGTVTLYGLKV